MNIRVRHPIFTHPLSPFTYLFYTPEFHLGHHALFRANYALFMPLWDRALGTHREFQKDDSGLLPAKQQDFVFIGLNNKTTLSTAHLKDLNKSLMFLNNSNKPSKLLRHSNRLLNLLKNSNKLFRLLQDSNQLHHFAHNQLYRLNKTQFPHTV